MEEILIVILQAFFEFFLELILYVGLDLAAWGFRDEKDGGAGCGWIFVFMFLGAGLGALANWIHPKTLLPFAWMRIANLLVGPFLVAWASKLWTEARKERGRNLVPANHFYFALLFTFAFNLVRFLYADHR